MVQRPFLVTKGIIKYLQELSHNNVINNDFVVIHLHLFALLQHATFTKENLVRKREKIFLPRKLLYTKYCL